MALFLLKRLGHMVIVLIGVTIVVFALIQLVPGDPVRLAMGTRFDPDVYAALREASGLNRPLLEQYFSYLGNAITGNLGSASARAIRSPCCCSPGCPPPCRWRSPRWWWPG